MEMSVAGVAVERFVVEAAAVVAVVVAGNGFHWPSRSLLWLYWAPFVVFGALVPPFDSDMCGYYAPY